MPHKHRHTTELALGAEVASTARQGCNAMGEHSDRHGLTGLRQTLAVRLKKRQAKAANDHSLTA